MKQALMNGPVSVNVEASGMAFQGYSTGILDGSECGANIDHSVLLVGWGTNSLGKEYYTVKNSWGETWGDSGFGKIAVENG